jgi:hypothetical protein
MEEAVAALKQIDPENKRFVEVVNELGNVLRGENNLLGVMALVATVNAVIDSSAKGNQESINFLYQLAIDTISKAAFDAGVFEELIDAMEKQAMLEALNRESPGGIN